MQGILFKPEMTLANLKGLKTRTSRTRGLQKINENPDNWTLEYEELGTFYFVPKDKSCIATMVKCPFGQVGSELYGKETYWEDSGDLYYKSDYPLRFEGVYQDKPMNMVLDNSHWKSPMMMPEWASRYHIILEKIIVQRIQEISEDDSQKEGVVLSELYESKGEGYKIEFINLWDSINYKTYPWSSNPWVWVLYYRVEKKA